MSKTTDWDQFSTDPFGTLGSAVTNNPGVALGALGLGGEAAMGQRMPKGYNQMQGEAQQLGNLGSSMLQTAQSGVLPPSAQAGLKQQASADTARIRQTYAAQGLSGSTMEVQALQDVGQRTQAAIWTEMQGFYKTGLEASGMSADLYGKMFTVNAAQDQAFIKAAAGFAAALGGAGQGQGGGQ